MDVDFSPSGHEFVAGGFDRTLRLFEKAAPGSRDVYFTPRMSRLSSVRFSRDATYVFSGSEDMNVRMWKVWHSCGTEPTNCPSDISTSVFVGSSFGAIGCAVATGKTEAVLPCSCDGAVQECGGGPQGSEEPSRASAYL